jgi:lysophospholipase L1-like esterase
MTNLSALDHDISPVRTTRAALGREWAALFAAVWLAATLLPGAAAAAPAPCPEGGRAEVLEGRLPHLASRFARSGALKIVTIGSSSTAGAGATSPDHSYPSQLESDLQRRFPGRDIDVVNAGVNGQEVPEMLARLDRDVLAHRPDLVIWQFGSNALLRGRSTQEMEAAARAGIGRLKAAGVEVILMDLQHAPRIDSVASRDDILNMMKRLSHSTQTALFHRYRLMKAWAATMGSGYGRMVAPDQLHMTDASYYCMADALAESLQGIVTAGITGTRLSDTLAAATRSAIAPRSATSR